MRRDEGFGRRLAAAMDRADVRPGALAKAQGVSPGTVSRWRAGECPDDLRFPSLAAFLRVGEEWLKTGRGEPERDQAAIVPSQPRGPGRRQEDIDLRAGALRKDGARLEVIGRLLQSYRDAGQPIPVDMIIELLAILQANSPGNGPLER